MTCTAIANHLKKVTVYATPFIISRMITSVGSFIAIVLLARFSEIALIASAFITSTQLVILVTGVSVLFSVSILVSHAMGSKKYSEIGSILHHGFILSMIMTLVLFVIFWSIGFILNISGQPKDVVPIVSHYFKIFAFAIPAMMISAVIQQVLYGIGKQNIVVLFDILNVVLLVSFGVTFIYGKIGFSPMGVNGLAYATVMQAWIVALLLVLYIYFQSSFHQFNFFKRTHFNVKQLKILYSIGWPISMNILAELLSLFVITIMAGWLGSQMLVVQQISYQYLFLMIIPLFGISQAVSVLVSNSCGRSQLSEIKDTIYSALIIGGLIILFSIFAITRYPTLLISLFIDIHDPKYQHLFHLIVLVLQIIMIGQIFDLIKNIYISALRGVQDSKKPMFVSIFCTWGFAVPLAYLLGIVYHGGIVGIFIADDIGIFISSVILVNLWLSKKKTMNLNILNDYQNSSAIELEKING